MDREHAAAGGHGGCAQHLRHKRSQEQGSVAKGAWWALRAQVKGIKETLKTATAAPATPPQDNKFQAANDKFLNSEYEKQQLIMK